MSKSSFIIGLSLAIALHVLILWPGFGRKETYEKAKEEQKEEQRRIVIVPSDQRPTPEPLPPNQKHRAQPRQRDAQILKNVVKASGDNKSSTAEGDTSSKNEEDSLPPLRIIWESDRQLRSVAGSLGLKIVAVDHQSKIIGEVVTTGDPRLVEFNGDLSLYSNRVRTLPSSFLGSEKPAGVRVSSFWILVPAYLDKRFVDIQRDAIRQHGLRMSEVRAVEAVFQWTNGAYRLVISRVVEA
jgi:hypothetical protein